MTETIDAILGGRPVRADISGALYLPDAGTLIVADLHLGKGARFAAQGTLLPPYDTQATLRSLSAAIARHRPKCVVCLGDSFDDIAGDRRLTDIEIDNLLRLTGQYEWVWVSGNHDPLPATRAGGRTEPEIEIDGILLRHEASLESEGIEISGHFHPKARVSARGRTQSRRCFVIGKRRIVMPAFGAYAGGLDVRDEAISRLFEPDFATLVIGDRRIHRIPASRLS